MSFPRLKIAVSDCLRGTPCRYNGGHAQDDFVNQHLAQYADFYPFCPEDAVMGSPRETIRLVGEEDDTHLPRTVVRGTKTHIDYTAPLHAYNHTKVAHLLTQNIDGAVVKARSPSCGLERIKVYQPTGQWHGSKDPLVTGLFTQHLIEQAPHLAIEEENRLQDAWLREQFVLRVFTSARWREFVSPASSESTASASSTLPAQPTVATFQAFHRDHKYLLLSKNQTLYKHMGALVATTRAHNLTNSLESYQACLFELLACSASKGQVKNVLDHIYGYFKTQLSHDQKNHYHQTSAEFVNGIIPLIAVIKVLQQFLTQYPSSYLVSQVFFNPYPADLALRSQVEAFR
ncbi:YbgA family protein [Thiomicrorhabdus aquaedulcis]|uniref:YbgA family protein n=1 Tax=Thiomicrorhabdus aquaedulcis TaxID=2211106 RepID=UPI000FD8A902|nr:DUF523 and DUF1722 domain-containing protein [Thiomicrorhabdus aquaedulcis]